MATWTFPAYMARLAHETKQATTERGTRRLRQTLTAVEDFLTATEHDPDEDGWCQLLSAYEKAATAVGLRHG